MAAYHDWLADPRSAPYRDSIFKYSSQYGLDPGKVAQQIGAESAFNPTAVSSTGAQGLMQVLPSTARDPGYGVTPLTNAFDPDSNIRFGTQYLAARGGFTQSGLAGYSGGDYNSGTTNNILRGSDAYNSGQIGPSDGTTSVAGGTGNAIGVTQGTGTGISTDGMGGASTTLDETTITPNTPIDPNALQIRVKPRGNPDPMGQSYGSLPPGFDVPSALNFLGGQTSRQGSVISGSVAQGASTVAQGTQAAAGTLSKAAKTASVDAGSIAQGAQSFVGDLFVRAAIVVLALIFVAVGLAFFGKGGSIDPGAIAKAAKNPVKSASKAVRAVGDSARGAVVKTAKVAVTKKLI